MPTPGPLHRLQFLQPVPDLAEALDDHDISVVAASRGVESIMRILPIEAGNAKAGYCKLTSADQAARVRTELASIMQ